MCAGRLPVVGSLGWLGLSPESQDAKGRGSSVVGGLRNAALRGLGWALGPSYLSVSVSFSLPIPSGTEAIALMVLVLMLVGAGASAGAGAGSM